jgi:Xaa-Pro aminopeptidase
MTIITDSRYLEEAEEAAKAPVRAGVKTGVALWAGTGLAQAAVKFVRGRKVTVGAEENSLTVSLWKGLRKALSGRGRVKPADHPVAQVRRIKDKRELVLIQKAIRVAEQAMMEVRPALKPGLRERQVAMMLYNAMVTYGAEGPSFPTIAASGPGASRPHYETSDKKIKAGEAVLIDWGAKVNGYVSDLTRVLFMGRIVTHVGRAYETLITARNRAIAAIKSGADACNTDLAARGAIEEAGYKGRFTHSLGHGIGLEIHEGPHIGPRSKDKLMPGMVFTIEPGIYVPGKWGLRLEDDFAVNTHGEAERLGRLPFDTEWAVVDC